MHLAHHELENVNIYIVDMCRVAQLEHLTFKQQMAIFAESQVIVMTHGAALGSVMFMSLVTLLCSFTLPNRVSCSCLAVSVPSPFASALSALD